VRLIDDRQNEKGRKCSHRLEFFFFGRVMYPEGRLMIYRYAKFYYDTFHTNLLCNGK
jgi:hypothetical protein